MRLFPLIYSLLFCALAAQAQDTIVRTNGDEVKARVLTVTPATVTYVPTVEPVSNDTLRIAAAEVFVIRYANGTKQLISGPAAPAPGVGAGLARTSEEMNREGQNDAKLYFKSPGAFWGTAGATLISASVYGLGGVAAGAVFAATPPKPRRMVVPDQALLNDPNYVSGYQKQAQRQKLGKAAAGFGVGIATAAVATVILIAALFNQH